MRSNERGYTLIEFLVSGLLAGILIAGVIAAFVSCYKNAAQQFEMIRLQQRGFFAIHRMSYLIRMAGYHQCVSDKLTAAAAIHVLDKKALYKQYRVRGLAGSQAIVVEECVMLKQKMQYRPIIFYLAKTSHKSVTALYEKIVGSRAQQLIEGAKQLYAQLDSNSNDAVCGVSIQLQLQSLTHHYRQTWPWYIALRESS